MSIEKKGLQGGGGKMKERWKVRRLRSENRLIREGGEGAEDWSVTI